MSLWPSPELLLSSVSSPPTPFYTSVAGKILLLISRLGSAGWSHRVPVSFAPFLVEIHHSGVMLCPSRAVLEGLWLRFQGEQVEVCVRREQRRRILQTLVWFVVTLVLALFIPDIGRVISLIGGLAACFIFVFPGNISLH